MIGGKPAAPPPPVRFVSRRVRDAAKRMLDLNYKEFQFVALTVADKLVGASDRTQQFWGAMADITKRYADEEAAFEEWAAKQVEKPK